MAPLTWIPHQITDSSNSPHWHLSNPTQMKKASQGFLKGHLKVSVKEPLKVKVLVKGTLLLFPQGHDLAGHDLRKPLFKS